jgi:hypothetical protein
MDVEVAVGKGVGVSVGGGWVGVLVGMGVMVGVGVFVGVGVKTGVEVKVGRGVFSTTSSTTTVSVLAYDTNWSKGEARVQAEVKATAKRIKPI